MWLQWKEDHNKNKEFYGNQDVGTIKIAWQNQRDNMILHEQYYA